MQQGGDDEFAGGSPKAGNRVRKPQVFSMSSTDIRHDCSKPSQPVHNHHRSTPDFRMARNNSVGATAV
jgi:hypothetical protein